MLGLSASLDSSGPGRRMQARHRSPSESCDDRERKEHVEGSPVKRREHQASSGSADFFKDGQNISKSARKKKKKSGM